jgi:hypothetical protein
MANREMSKETWAKINEIILKIKNRARKNGDIETIKDAERVDALMQSLGIEIWLEDSKSEQK